MFRRVLLHPSVAIASVVVLVVSAMELSKYPVVAEWVLFLTFQGFTKAEQCRYHCRPGRICVMRDSFNEECVRPCLRDAGCGAREICKSPTWMGDERTSREDVLAHTCYPNFVR